MWWWVLADAYASQVVIVSTVRARKELTSSDAEHGIGFMSDPARLNTVLSRAISLVVMVGDEIVLGHDPTWNALLKKCKALGVYVPSEQAVGEPEELGDNGSRMWVLNGGSIYTCVGDR
eukprot:m.418126 g.418126  ORF g.418126 m.418126 type:complete len:119 (+) comp21289_c0_seq1:484-840(+)